MRKTLLILVIVMLSALGLTAVKAAPVQQSSYMPWLSPNYWCQEVVYSPWGECIYGFNVQLRDIIERPGNCQVTTNQQVERIKYCDSSEYFGYNLR